MAYHICSSCCTAAGEMLIEVVPFWSWSPVSMRKAHKCVYRIRVFLCNETNPCPVVYLLFVNADVGCDKRQRREPHQLTGCGRHLLEDGCDKKNGWCGKRRKSTCDRRREREKILTEQWKLSIRITICLRAWVSLQRNVRVNTSHLLLYSCVSSLKRTFSKLKSNARN